MAQSTARALPAAAWILRFQLEDNLFAKAMPPVMLSTLLALAAATALSQGTARRMFLASLVFMAAVLVVTIGFEVPLNKQIQSWTADAPPPQWEQTRDLWLQRHVLRTIAATLAFVAAILGIAI
jgi:uncharacterized membrane protein